MERIAAHAAPSLAHAASASASSGAFMLLLVAKPPEAHTPVCVCILMVDTKIAHVRAASLDDADGSVASHRGGGGSSSGRKRPRPPLLLREDLDLNDPSSPVAERLHPAWQGTLLLRYAATLLLMRSD